MDDKDNLIIRYNEESALQPLVLRRALRVRAAMLSYVQQLAVNHEQSSPAPSGDALILAQHIASLRPTSNTLIDQCPIMPEDMVRRLEIIRHYLAPLAHRSILFIGDDDLVSPMLLQQGTHLVALVDIDARILESVESFARELNKTDHLNLYEGNFVDIVDGRQPDVLDERLFDAVVTDPPYTENGYYYFLGYGLQHLKLGGRAFIALPHMHLEQWTDELLYKVEGFLFEQGMMVEELLPSFAIYDHDEGVISSMIVAKKVSLPQKNLGASYNANRLYTTGIQSVEIADSFETLASDDAPDPIN